MNKAIITALIGLAIGATGGYCACHFIEKSKNEKAISDGIQNALDQIRGRQKEKAIENESKKEEMIKTTGRNVYGYDAVPLTKMVLDDVLNENGYVSKEPEGKPDTDDNGLPFEEPSKEDVHALELAEKHNIWDEPDPSNLENAEDYEARQEPEGIDMTKLDPTRPPYEITSEQFNDELNKETEQGFWDKTTLILFKDNVFAERTSKNDFQTMSSMEINAAIGNDNVKKMIDDISIKRLFVRNNKLHIDYEIVASDRSYSSAIQEEDEE